MTVSVKLAVSGFIHGEPPRPLAAVRTAGRCRSVERRRRPRRGLQDVLRYPRLAAPNQASFLEA